MQINSLVMPEKRSTLSLLLERQVSRYKRKGFKNCAIAFALLYIIVVGGTSLGRYLWPQTIANPELFTVMATLFIHVFFQILYFLIYLPGYKGNEAYERYLINKDMKKPWQRQNWSTMKLRTAWYLFLNKVVVFPLIIYLSMKTSGVKTRFHDFPSSLQVFTQLIIVMAIQDFFFFWFHKLSHENAFLYKYHKIHHQFDFVFTLAAEYSHPIDYILGILIPSALPFMLLGQRSHCFMLMFWQVWKIYISSEGHSGYEIPWSPTRILPFVSGASYHDFHHSKNVGNYAGSVYIWDTIMGTNHLYFDKIEQKTQPTITGNKKQ